MGLPDETLDHVYFKKLPKVDLHRHLEGSLRVSTLMDIAREHGITLPLRPGLPHMVQMQPHDPFNFSVFLSKFQTLRLFFRSPEVISRLTHEAIADAAADGVIHLELRFTPVALSRAEGFELSSVMDWVCQAAKEASAKFGISTCLIASVNRHESTELAEQVARLAAERIHKGIVALDLAGNEAEFAAEPFTAVFKEAHASGLKLTVHAGEWSGPEAVRTAMLQLEADRIGHGVRTLEDPEISALAAERYIPFEVCITSNYQTGVVPALSAHPFARMLNAGLNATINTDDPSISQITLSDEYQRTCQDIGLHPDTLNERILAAARASFLSEAEKQTLINRITTALEER